MFWGFSPPWSSVLSGFFLFLFSLNGDHIRRKAILTEVLYSPVWASPRENVRQPELALLLHTLVSMFLPSVNHFSQLAAISGGVICLSVYFSSWLEILQSLGSLPSPLLKMNFKGRNTMYLPGKLKHFGQRKTGAQATLSRKHR